MSTIRIERYQPSMKSRWNEFVKQSKNGTFLFDRDYMEYHSDRFTDHSLLLFSDDRLVAVLPACETGDTLSSHGGLTFGGVISAAKLRTATMLEIFQKLLRYASSNAFSKMLYKASPAIYHRYPAEEDRYALFRFDALLIRRDVSSAILLCDRMPYSKGRRSSTKQALKNNLQVERSYDFHEFMELEARHLETKFGVSPTHTGDEMSMLAQRFPDNIKLYTSRRDGALLGGAIIYESPHLAHTQYIAATEVGSKLGAHDRLMDYLLNQVYLYPQWRYFDFGISTEQAGRCLNHGLIQNKESYGASAVCYDWYEIPTSVS